MFEKKGREIINELVYRSWNSVWGNDNACKNEFSNISYFVHSKGVIMFEKDDSYWEAKLESKSEFTKVIKFWSGKEASIYDKGFEDGAKFGYEKGLKVKINTTTISDYSTTEYAKTIIKDLLNNSDEYARQRAIDFLKKEEEDD